MTASTVPPLIVADSSEPVSDITDLSAPEVEVCLDAQGEVLGYCRLVDGQPRMHVPNLAAFHYERDLGQVRAVLHRPLSLELIIETYRHCVLPVGASGDRHVGAFFGEVGGGLECFANQPQEGTMRLTQHQQIAGLRDVLRRRAPMHPAAMRLADNARRVVLPRFGVDGWVASTTALYDRLLATTPVRAGRERNGASASVVGAGPRKP